VTFGCISLSVLWQLLGMTLVSLGLVGVYAGIISKVLFDYKGDETITWMRRLRYTRTSVGSALVTVSGLFATFPLIRAYFDNDLSLPPLPNSSVHLAITGLTMLISGGMTFIFMLVIHASVLSSRFRTNNQLH
jgi:hypothetical protein